MRPTENAFKMDMQVFGIKNLSDAAAVFFPVKPMPLNTQPPWWRYTFFSSHVNEGMGSGQFHLNIWVLAWMCRSPYKGLLNCLHQSDVSSRCDSVNSEWTSVASSLIKPSIDLPPPSTALYWLKCCGASRMKRGLSSDWTSNNQGILCLEARVNKVNRTSQFQEKSSSRVAPDLDDQ